MDDRRCCAWERPHSADRVFVPDFSEVRAALRDLVVPSDREPDLAALAVSARDVCEVEGANPYHDDAEAATECGRLLLAMALIAAGSLAQRQSTRVWCKEGLESFGFGDGDDGWPHGAEISVVRRRDDGDKLRLQVESDAIEGWPDCWLFELVGDELVHSERVVENER